MAGSKLTLQQVSGSFIDFTNDELLSLNRYLCDIIKQRNTIKRMQATVGFAVGDKVTFTDRLGKTRKATVAKVKRVMIAVVESADSSAPGMRWNVGSTILRKA